MSGFSHHQDQYLDGPEIEALRAGTFELDCPSITFARNSRSKSPSYSGPGSVSQTSEGNLHFKLYSNTPIDDFLYVELQTLAGTLLSEDRYYTLTLLDAAGREWICDSVPPFFKVVRTSNGAIVIGTIEELKTCVVRNDITERSFCEMRFFGDYIFPRNIPTKTITTIEDKIVEDSFHLNVAKVSTGKYEMQFKQENGYLLATVKTDSSEMPARLANRVAQALEFVLGQPTDYYILRSSENGKWSDSIRSVRYQDVRRGVPRPLQCNFVDPTGNFWKLFSCFLEHINLHSELIYPPLYRITHSLILSSNEPLDTQALTLSVAIEDLLATEFPDEGRPSEEFIADIKKAQALIESSDVSVTGKQRIKGAIGALKNTRAKDRLIALVRSNIITDEQFKAWDTVRNAAAHANFKQFEGFEGHQNLITLYGRMLVLFYHLVFKTIDYGGSYTDYSETGWPERKYGSNGSHE